MSDLKYGPRNMDKLWFIYVRDIAICHLCEKFVPWDEASRDHITPKSALKQAHIFRPSRSVDVKLAHKKCNRERGRMNIVAYKIMKGFLPSDISYKKDSDG